MARKLAKYRNGIGGVMKHGGVAALRSVNNGGGVIIMWHQKSIMREK
jgi:hypothetical protein